MLLAEDDTEVFKRWVQPKLETISDADAEVLADYVVALVTTKDEDANIRRNCIDSLSDFLQDNTAPFVDEVIRTLKDKSYAAHRQTIAKSDAPAPIPSIVGASTSEYLPRPAYGSNAAPPHAPKGPAADRAPSGQHAAAAPSTGTAQRKRKQNDREPSQSRDHANDRPVKQTARRGARNGRANLNAQAPAFAPVPNMPQFNPALGEIPPFDPTNPMSFLAMAAAFGISLPGMPPLPTFNAQGEDLSSVRCVDYDTKGFCAIGSMCPYQHELEYDPTQPAQGMDGARRRSAGRGSHGRPSGGRTRAPFSLPGPTRDRNNTTIVVEQIPEDNFSEEDVRAFFGKFGAILDVRMQAYKRLAVVTYETHEAASAAYNSPKVIFDNRFVKVYWHKSDGDLGSHHHFDHGDEGGYVDSEVLDPEELSRRQAEAQRVFEERRKREEEAAAKAEEIERKLQETNAEILRVRRELARVSGAADPGLEDDFSQDLATLQAEAETLFAQQDSAAEAWSASARGAYRGGYRGRGYASRARGFRGGYRGRGAFSGAWMGVKRLDNRPRRIAIKGVEPGSHLDEALRQHLFTIPDLLATDAHPEHPTTLILTFAERYQAESFIDTAHAIPDVPALDMEWVANDALGGIGGDGDVGVGVGVDGDVGINAGRDNAGRENTGTAGVRGRGREGEGVAKAEGDENGKGDGRGRDAAAAAKNDTSKQGKIKEEDVDVDMDMDVAEDEDQWL